MNRQVFPFKAANWLLPLLLLLFWSGQTLANDPEQLVRQTSDNVLSKVLANKASLKASPGKLYGLIRSYILPHLDFYSMSQTVLGKHWSKASKGEQQAFVVEFRELLIRTYGTALLNYSGKEIQYSPAKVSGKYAVVRTKVPSSGGSPVSIDYRLSQRGSGWKVIDIKVGGVSLVSNYRTSFSSKASQIGVGGLVKELKAKNAG